MYINPYLYSDVNIEKVINPYFISTLTPANAINPYLSSSAKDIYLSPTQPYVLSSSITIEKNKDDSDDDDDKKKIKN